MKNSQYSPTYLLPFKLHNIKDFVVGKFNNYHPVYERALYESYWRDQADKCIRGMWGHDYSSENGLGGYRWMPGNLYFYINMTVIKVEGDEGRESVSNPSLRDIEWYLFYALAECDGFSGFENDSDYTCYLPLGKMQGKVFDDKGNKITTLSNQDKIRLDRYDNFLRKKDGDYKEYIDVKTYLYKTYDEPQGRPLYLNEMQNLVVLSTRGCGKSYSVAGGVVLYDFVFGSSRTADEFFAQSNPSVTVVGSYESSKSQALLNKFEEAYEHIRKNVGSFPSDGINSPFYQPYEGSLKPSRHITNGVKEEGGKSITGTGSELWHVSYKDNPNAGVGYRARRMVCEEAGLMSNFLDVHSENSGTQRRETKIGYTIYIGTGGNIEKIKGIREAFYNPSSFECVGFKDIFSKKNGNIGLFIPSYYRSIDYKDENGNTDVEAAFEDEMLIRESKKSSGSKAYDGHIVSYPIVPSEMFLQTQGNIFPSGLIETRLTELETGEWEKIASVGTLTHTNREKTSVVWMPRPIHESSIIKRWGDEKGMTDKELEGSIVVYEHPVSSRPELNYYNFMYLVTYDSVKDEDGGTSLASVDVWKFWDFDNPDKVQFNLVAEWVGRHIGTDGLEKDHEVAFKLASYYNAPIIPEVNLKDVLRYGRMTNRWRYFLPKPQLAINGMETKQKKEYEVGIYISPTMKPDLEKYLNESLHVVVSVEHKLYGKNEIFNEVKMVSKLPSMRLCEELLYYNRAGNFDKVSSAMLFGVVKRQKEEQPIADMYDEYTKSVSNDYINFVDSNIRSKEETIHHPAFSY